MRWINRRQSENVEDRRGNTTRYVVGGGVGTLVIAVIVLLLGGDPGQLLENMGGTGYETASEYQPTETENQLAQFVSVVLAETEDVWDELFRNSGYTYRKPTLVLFSGSVESACGFGHAASGPFYCPGDEKVYIDLSFCNELQTSFQAPGDFAIAYVIAHEVGHHVQNLLGVNERVAQMQSRVSQREANQYSIALELQADFYAGVWANHAQRMHQILEEGDIEEGLNAASAVGDDRIMKRTQGTIVPDAFTHGTSAQRQAWFKKGFDTGDPDQGNTFEAL